jgi:hypothetical protein
MNELFNVGLMLLDDVKLDALDLVKLSGRRHENGRVPQLLIPQMPDTESPDTHK